MAEELELAGLDGLNLETQGRVFSRKIVFDENLRDAL